MTESPFDPERVLRTLNSHHVKFVVIGGLASQILGLALVTRDTDICYERSPENMERLAAALKELGAKLRVARVEGDLPFLLDAKTIAAGDSFTFNTNAGPFDILATPSGTGGFRDLDARAGDYDFGNGLVVRVVDLDDLIRMKESAGRAKDVTHLHELATLKEMLDQADPPA
ncbi:MAG: hypothetical protein M3Z84_05255 [Actinomycetota bacterium]|nr:hypothetical protein [Actinomycetota bacterium]